MLNKSNPLMRNDCKIQNSSFGQLLTSLLLRNEVKDTYIFATNFIEKAPSVSLKIYQRQFGLINCIIILKKFASLTVFSSILGFFHEHSRFTGQEVKGEAISLTFLYHFHPLHRHLDISRAITAESSHSQQSGLNREPLVSECK